MGIRIYGGEGMALSLPMGDSVATAAEVFRFGVSRGGILKYDVENISFSGTSGWWKFTAEESAPITFDVGLSYNMFTGRNTVDDPTLFLNVYTGPSGATSIDDLDYVDETFTSNVDYPEYPDTIANRDALTVLVTAGQTYYISVDESNSRFNTITYLRVSDYGEVGEWNTPDLKDVRVPSWSENPAGTYHPYGADPVVNTTSLSKGPSYTGSYELWRAFGGPAASDPGDPTPFPAGPTCAWKWARRGALGSQWWSKYGGNGGPPGTRTGSWNGTDPYNGSVDGYGTCRIYGAGIYESSASHSTIGIRYYSEDPPDPYHDTRCYSYAMSGYMNVTAVQTWLNTHNGGFAVPPETEDMLTYQSAEGDVEIIEFGVAGDEPVASSTSMNGHVEWYYKVITSRNDTPDQQWGPNRGGFNGQSWQGHGDGPEGMAARNDLAFQYLGGFQNYHAIPLAAIEAAKEAEANWPVGQSPATGLRFIGIHPLMKSDTLPSVLQPFDGYSIDNLHYRFSQSLSIRLIVQPKDYRKVYKPVIPSVEEITGKITGLEDINRAVFRYKGTG